MRVGFLFVEHYPNYELDFEIFDTMTSDERYQLSTYIRTGIWGAMQTGSKTIQELQIAILNMLHQGNRREVRDFDDLINKAMSELIYVVLFESMHPDLAKKIHNRLIENSKSYMGYSEVMPEGLHIAFFSMLPVRYKFTKGKLYVLYSEPQENEFVANDIIEWVEQHRPMSSFRIKKMDIGWRFTMVDSNDNHPKNDLENQRAIQTLGYEWDDVIEPTIYTMLETVPDAVGELRSALEVVRNRPLTNADCAKVSVNIRRMFEKTARYLAPAHPNMEYRKQLKSYITETFKNSKEYQEYLSGEIDEVVNRIDKLAHLTNKGVHEDWMVKAVNVILLRSVLSIGELLMPLKITNPSIHYDVGFFEIDDE